MNLRLVQVIEANGHPNILGTHKTTIELTKDSELTKNGDCIIGVRSDHSCSDLSDECKVVLQSDLVVLQSDNEFLVKILVNNHEDSFRGFGNKGLTLQHTHDIVFRKSEYICNRTIMIRCSKAACDIDREIMKEMKNPSAKIRIEILAIESE
jgi:hypothetical protein